MFQVLGSNTRSAVQTYVYDTVQQNLMVRMVKTVTSPVLHPIDTTTRMVKRAGSIGASVTSTVTSPVLHPIDTAKNTAKNTARMVKRAGSIGATVTSTVTSPVLHPIDTAKNTALTVTSSVLHPIDTAINVTSYVNPLSWIRSKPDVK